MLSHVSFVTLPVTDIGRATAFWRDVMGCEVTADAPYGSSRWVTLAIEGARTEIHLGERAEMPESREPAVPLIAPDVPAAIATLRERGVTVAAEPQPAEWDPAVTYAMIRDSEGNLILLTSS